MIKNKLKRQILVFTSSIDKTCDYLEEKYKEVSFFRFNLDQFSSYLITVTANGFEIILGDTIIDNKSCCSIYYRKPMYEALDNIFDDKYHSFAHKEAHSIIEGITESFDGICLSRPSIMKRAGNKIFQATLAKKIGFNIPELHITNNDKIVKNLSEESIVKPISVGYIIENNEKEFVQTNLLDSKVDLSYLKYSPAYFQKYESKDFEVRVTFVSNKSFAVKIVSENQVDWRKYGNIINYAEIELPLSISNKCKEFMNNCNMDFGCFDFIVNGNKWHFLEMNVNGQWAWLEFETGVNISGELIRFLNKNA
jgi:glutathione synthase/RimK-type ligase-like ATP-grasp enzyme